MADTRPGKVVRLNPALLKLLKTHMQPKETWSKALIRLIGDPSMSMWTLPSKLYPTRAEASGVAVQEAAREGLPLESVEHPIKVMEKY